MIWEKKDSKVSFIHCALCGKKEHENCRHTSATFRCFGVCAREKKHLIFDCLSHSSVFGCICCVEMVVEEPKKGKLQKKGKTGWQWQAYISLNFRHSVSR